MDSLSSTRPGGWQAADTVESMAQPLSSLATWVTSTDWPRTECPVCTTGSVAFEVSQKVEDAESLELVDRVRRGLEAPDELSGSFTGTLRCDNRQCESRIAIAGNWIHACDYDAEHGHEAFKDFYALKYANPAFPIIRPPGKTPEAVKEALASASHILWLSPSGAANHLRQAVELLLTAKRVPKTTTTRRGKRVRLTTHRRIESYRHTRSDVADALEA